jgi:hypothetical protein
MQPWKQQPTHRDSFVYASTRDRLRLFLRNHLTQVFPKYGKLQLQGEDATKANQDALATRTEKAQISLEKLVGARALPNPLPEGYPTLEEKQVLRSVCVCVCVCVCVSL